MISPHFPPDASAATHRVRVIAPHLEQFGWRPTVLTVQPQDYEGRIDPALGAMVPASLDVKRVGALPSRWTRLAGLGDLGLRAFPALRKRAGALIAESSYDAVYITTYPIYPALLGPWIRRRFGIPFVLDLQDPWVGEWGRTVGGGRNGTTDLKSRVSRAAAKQIEKRVLPQAAAVTSVSRALLEELAERYSELRDRPRIAMPIGIDANDVEFARDRKTPALIDSSDGRVHLAYVGTMLPLATDTISALFAAVKQLRTSDPSLGARLHMHFVGTSNRSTDDVLPVVLARAREAGLGDMVTEHPQRIGYIEALQTLLAASIVLVLGSTERRYTASKLAPALASGRPLLVITHRESDIYRALQDVSRHGIAIAAFDDSGPNLATTDCIYRQLRAWVQHPPCERRVSETDLDAFSAVHLAQTLAGVLDVVTTETRG
jgi:glycosyltransferase involved in cell wall biosynthesis